MRISWRSRCIDTFSICRRSPASAAELTREGGESLLCELHRRPPAGEGAQVVGLPEEEYLSTSFSFLIKSAYICAIKIGLDQPTKLSEKFQKY